jgi:hypothetical protein
LNSWQNQHDNNYFANSNPHNLFILSSMEFKPSIVLAILFTFTLTKIHQDQTMDFFKLINVQPTWNQSITQHKFQTPLLL